jgi:3-methyladenine DNA glycosylase AlkD
MPGLDSLVAELDGLADPERAAGVARYFKTGPGEYAEGDRFLGIRVPDLRRVARRHRDVPLEEVERLLESPWHEHRLVALLILTLRYQRADEPERERIVGLYLARRAAANNWDLVDLSAPALLGLHLLHRPRHLLYQLAAAESVWDRRIAVLSTLAFIRRGDFADTLSLAERLLGDPHHLIHKAVGWMLREVGARDEATLVRFLTRHAPRMPRTMLRYAVERLPATQRVALLAARER